jgi:hypothetical protein
MSEPKANIDYAHMINEKIKYIKKLESMLNDLNNSLTERNLENIKLREALKFYASGHVYSITEQFDTHTRRSTMHEEDTEWITSDEFKLREHVGVHLGGKRARKALKEIEEK